MAGLVGIYRLDGSATDEDFRQVQEMGAASKEPAQYLAMRRAGSLCAAYIGYEFERHTQTQHIRESAGDVRRDAGIDVILTGYLFNDRELESLASPRGPKTAPEGLCELYRRYGNACIERLDGRFLALICDHRARRLVIGLDRFGHVPIYVRQTDTCLIFATSLIAHQVRSAPSLSLDRSATALYLRYRHFVGEGTYFNEVSLPPAASIISVDGAEVRRRKYWQFRLREEAPWPSKEEATDRMADAFIRSMARVGREPGAMAVPLSGGLDSRAIAGELHRRRRPFAAFTFGREGCRDITVAQEVTRRLGVAHTVEILEPDYLVKKASLIARRTDGAYPINHGHVSATLDAISPDYTVAVDGFTGEILSSEKVRDSRSPVAEHEVLALINKHYQTTPDTLMRALLPDLPPKMTLAESAGAALSSHGHRLAASVIDIFSLAQRQRRFTLNGPRILGGDARVFCPFWHYDYADACFDVSPRERSIQRPYVMMHRRLWPNLARVRWNKVGLPPALPVRLLRAFMPVDTALSWIYERAQRRVPMLPTKGLLKGFEDYNTWFREAPSLRTLVRDILLDPKTLNRGIYAPEAIRKAVVNHETGRARSADLLSLLMGTELFFRQIDEERA